MRKVLAYKKTHIIKKILNNIFIELLIVYKIDY